MLKIASSLLLAVALVACVSDPGESGFGVGERNTHRVPDGSPDGLILAGPVSAGGATEGFSVARVRVVVEGNHQQPSQLQVFLTAPSGRVEQLPSPESRILDLRDPHHLQNDGNYVLEATVDTLAGEPLEAEWTLKVVDVESGVEGTVELWEINWDMSR